MNQIFRRWLEITISIHFKLVGLGVPGGRIPPQWTFFCSKFIDKTPLFRLKRTPGINEIKDFFDCGIEIRPDQLNHLGSNIVNDTRRPKSGNFQPETEKFIFFFLRGGTNKKGLKSFLQCFLILSPFFQSPPLGLHLFPWKTHVIHPRNATGCTGHNMDCSQGTAMMKAPKAAEPM